MTWRSSLPLNGTCAASRSQSRAPAAANKSCGKRSISEQSDSLPASIFRF
uniref:Uncharacterized protein n=1 Tax=Arundo donax TaxID=35708 RepID=A0A0A9SME1_ARUDO